MNQALNNQAASDARKVVTGKDGQLFVTVPGAQIFLAEVDDFKTQLAFKDTDYQPIGSGMTYKINTGWSVSLTLSETVIRDDLMIDTLISAIMKGYVPTYDFQGKITRPYDGQTSRQVYRSCLPTSNIDLMNITPGQIIKRAWSFAVNATPEILSAFRS